VRGVVDFQIFVADAGLDDMLLGEPNSECDSVLDERKRDPARDGVFSKDCETVDIAEGGLVRE
jgi:hypothetical protein